MGSGSRCHSRACSAIPHSIGASEYSSSSSAASGCVKQNPRRFIVPKQAKSALNTNISTSASSKQHTAKRPIGEFNTKLLDSSEVAEITELASVGAADGTHKKVSLTINGSTTDRSTRVDRSIELSTLLHKHHLEMLQQVVPKSIESIEKTQ